MGKLYNYIMDNIDYISWRYGEDIFVAISLIALMLIINL